MHDYNYYIFFLNSLIILVPYSYILNVEVPKAKYLHDTYITIYI